MSREFPSRAQDSGGGIQGKTKRSRVLKWGENGYASTPSFYTHLHGPAMRVEWSLSHFRQEPLVPDRLEKQWVLFSAEAGLQSQVNLQSHLWSPRPEAPLWRS